MTSTDPHADPAACANPSMGPDQAATRPVRDVMITTPKTLPADATVAEARALLANPKVLAVPLVDGSAFAGLLEGEDLPAEAGAEHPVRRYARTSVPTITPDQPVRDAWQQMTSAGVVRLVVLGEDGRTLTGLLALDHHRTGFCQGS